MRKKILTVLLILLSYAAMDAILGYLLFQEDINVVESLFSSVIFCLIYFPVMSWFVKRQKAKENTNKET
jgi:hypothetical protein